MVFLIGISKLINSARIYEHCENKDNILDSLNYFLCCGQIPLPKLYAADLINSQWSLEESNAMFLCSNYFFSHIGSMVIKKSRIDISKVLPHFCM